MQINYWAVLVCALLSMVLGFVWYGPLFGKKWMHIMKAGDMSAAEREKMKKSATKLYILQFVLTLFQLFVLSWYIGTLNGLSSGVHTAFSIWIAFIIPTLAGVSMWNGDSAKTAWVRFLIQAGYQLIFFMIAGFILGIWR
jgi:hypothetical protein